MLARFAAAVDALDADAAARRPAASWDLSGYDSAATEDVPDRSGPQRRVTWYGSPSRHTAAAGELILARLLGPSAGEPVPPADLGARPPAGAAVDAIRAERRAARQRHVAIHLQEVADAQHLVDGTAGHRRPPCRA